MRKYLKFFILTQFYRGWCGQNEPNDAHKTAGDFQNIGHHIVRIFLMKSKKSFSAQQRAMVDTGTGVILTRSVWNLYFIISTKTTFPLPFGHRPPHCYHLSTELVEYQTLPEGQPSSFVSERVF